MWRNGQTVKERTHGHPKTKIHKWVHKLGIIPNPVINANRIPFITVDKIGEVNLRSKWNFTDQNNANRSIKKSNRRIPVWIRRNREIFPEHERKDGRMFGRAEEKSLKYGNIDRGPTK